MMRRSLYISLSVYYQSLNSAFASYRQHILVSFFNDFLGKLSYWDINALLTALTQIAAREMAQVMIVKMDSKESSVTITLEATTKRSSHSHIKTDFFSPEFFSDLIRLCASQFTVLNRL